MKLRIEPIPTTKRYVVDFHFSPIISARNYGIYSVKAAQSAPSHRPIGRELSAAVSKQTAIKKITRRRRNYTFAMG